MTKEGSEIMIFRVWCKNKEQWERDEVLLSEDGLMYQAYRHGLVRLSSDTHILEWKLPDTIHCRSIAVLLYVGDILHNPQLQIPTIKIVRENGEFFGVNPEESHKVERYGFALYDHVGNIHDNPELMEGGAE